MSNEILTELLFKEDMLDIKNCIIYHIMQQERKEENKPPLNIQCPSMYKSVTHYQKLFKKIQEIDKDENA